jgi:capsular exopolysaccharide synthesis family protein
MPVRYNRNQSPVNDASAVQAPDPFGTLAQPTLRPARDVREYLRVVYKRRWSAIGVFVLVLMAFVVSAFGVVPVYQARAQLLIEVDAPKVLTFNDVLDSSQTQRDYYETQFAILRSRSLAKRTIDALNMWDDPALGGGPARPAPFSLTGSIRSAGSSAWRWISSSWATSAEPDPPKEAPALDESAIQAARIDAFLAGLGIEPVRSSRIVEVSYRSTNPQLAAKLANAHARQYIEQTFEFKHNTSKEATNWLEAQLAEQRQKVEASELALQQYRQQRDAVSLEDRQNIVVQKLADLNGAVTKAKTTRIEKEALFRQVEAMSGDRAALDASHLVQSNEVIRGVKADLARLRQQETELSAKLGDRHPELMKLRATIDQTELRLRNEIDRVAAGVKSEYTAALAQERALTQALDSQKNEALDLDRKAVEYRTLERDAASNRQLFDSLLQRAKETGISGELKTSNVRMVDQAEVPRSPIGPGVMNNLVLGFLAAFLLGLGTTFALERVDNRIKAPEEIVRHLNLPLLGMLPALSKRKFFTRVPMVDDGVPPTFVEAFRVIRTNVMFASAQDGPRTVIVTSTCPHEGKTMVATNLAISLAMTGQRVVLIDADMRRPNAHQIFDRPQEPGLSNLLVGNAEVRDVVRPVTLANLFVVTAGYVPPNPAELLVSDRFKQFIEKLKTKVDWIVLDSPPVMAVIDAPIIAHLASGVVFVVGSEMASRPAITASLEQLDKTGATFFGVILNRIDLDRDAYYYSPYYSREYREYYDVSMPMNQPAARTDDGADPVHAESVGQRA